MAADINILTANSKERFPFPREVRFNRQGVPIWELFGVFFPVCFWTAQKLAFFCIFGVCLAIFGYFLADFEVILGPLWGIF